MTTVAIKEETMRLLRQTKKDMRADTFDEAIRQLLLEHKRPKESLFGAMKTGRSFERKELDRLH